MIQYRVDVDGETVWSDETEEYEGTQKFPAEYRQVRPESGHEICLFINDELIGRQISQADEDAEVAAAKAAAEGSDDQ